ncbi:MAG: glycoside hydrolase family 38 C-terminal domain-containing protein [Bacteroidota bacterium]|nr:glycoside hydrolase family 38 C-terminal domain-containing protein [Bacteroidota bacterium]
MTRVTRKYLESLLKKYRTAKFVIALQLFAAMSLQSFGQKAYFIDGYHGGVWGHYPDGFTRFVVDKLKTNPDWKINIEIEPETWDRAEKVEPEAYREFQTLFADQSVNGRIEYVNPSYAQSYMFNISGESIIRQFSYGIRKVKVHFPGAVFTTYSVEEPCFTSALPQVLKSFGIRYASLKNPNTCWGGYTRAFGGELINWVGPDGTKLPTVPRYEIEKLDPNSTWQTIASGNSPEYVNAALNYGIQHPVGMCFQDAGWKIGPWLGDSRHAYNPSEYKTWRDYFENVAIKTPQKDWAFSQEDVQVSLVWGAQVLQKLAQRVRVSENKIVRAEKLAALAKVYTKANWPAVSFDEAWRGLLLSQHHDCWIVPYNGGRGNSWADKVVGWTGITNSKSDSIIHRSIDLLNGNKSAGQWFVRVINTLGTRRTDYVAVDLPSQMKDKDVRVLNSSRKEVASQIISGADGKKLLFRADVPSVGYETYSLQMAQPAVSSGAGVVVLADGTYKLESDLYRIIIDPSKGGMIKSIVAKTLDNKEFVDVKNERGFNEVRGNFYNDGGFHSSSDKPAVCKILENGPLRVKVAVDGMIANNPFTQIITLVNGERRIDVNLKIDWQNTPGIGEFSQMENYKATDYKKAFYNDKYKLLALFPLNLKNQKVFKDAPFDVTESKLTNTFFSTWDSIKNNIILNWVDVEDGSGEFGCALLTDHTSSYAHGADFPLGLTLQYSGKGLWGMDYKLTEPTEVNYALVPHKGKWDKSGIWTEANRWNEPLIPSLMQDLPSKDNTRKSLVDVAGSGLEITSIVADGNDLVVRFFNAEGTSEPTKVSFDFKAAKAELVELNGTVIAQLPISKAQKNHYALNLTVPKFGIRTLRFTNVGK